MQFGAPGGVSSGAPVFVWGGNALEAMLEREFERPAFCAADVVIFQIGLEHGVAGF